MNESDQHPRRDASAWGTWTALILALSPLLYVLSIGPAGWLQKEGYVPRQVRTAYAPVIWLHNHTALEKPLEWYGELCGWKWRSFGSRPGVRPLQALSHRGWRVMIDVAKTRHPREGGDPDGGRVTVNVGSLLDAGACEGRIFFGVRC